jgi:hypothetical protein
MRLTSVLAGIGGRGGARERSARQQVWLRV